MRLKDTEIHIIKTAAREAFGDDVKVYLFSSRTDDQKKGGDIDLYIETSAVDILPRKLKMLRLLEQGLGERKIDIIVNNFRSGKNIFTIARSEGLRL